MTNNIERAYELTLIVRSQMGDETAFEQLLRMYSPRLRFYVSKMLHERHESADDLLQEIWLSAYRALPRLKDATAFRAWLFRIARDRVCREFRRARMKFDSLEGADVEELTAESNNEEPVDAEAVRRQIANLSPEHREVLLLRFVEEMSYEEISRVTGSTLGTVRSRIHYAKQALRRAYEENSYELK